MSYEAVPTGQLAAVVTFLEIRDRPNVAVPPSQLTLRRLPQPDAETYRLLFRLVGSPWLWFSRLAIDDAALAAIIDHPNVELFVVEDREGRDAGMLELDFREQGQCELAFLGLVPELAGQGHGRWLLAEAVSRAWREGIERVHVHTCTLDHSAALGAYRRAGFIACKRAIERFPDPRLNGILPKDCAPQVPLIG